MHPIVEQWGACRDSGSGAYCDIRQRCPGLVVARATRPFRVQTRSLEPSQRTSNTTRLLPGAKLSGCPRLASPGVNMLLGPTGICTVSLPGLLKPKSAR
jgi:hypothetical protein